MCSPFTRWLFVLCQRRRRWHNTNRHRDSVCLTLLCVTCCRTLPGTAWRWRAWAPTPVTTPATRRCTSVPWAAAWTSERSWSPAAPTWTPAHSPTASGESSGRLYANEMQMTEVARRRRRSFHFLGVCRVSFVVCVFVDLYVLTLQVVLVCVVKGIHCSLYLISYRTDNWL